MVRKTIRVWSAIGGILGLTLAGCGHKAESKVAADTTIKPVFISVAEIEHRPVERTVDVVGSLKGLEEVTLSAKKSGPGDQGLARYR